MRLGVPVLRCSRESCEGGGGSRGEQISDVRGRVLYTRATILASQTRDCPDLKVEIFDRARERGILSGATEELQR